MRAEALASSLWAKFSYFYLGTMELSQRTEFPSNQSPNRPKRKMSHLILRQIPYGCRLDGRFSVDWDFGKL